MLLGFLGSDKTQNGNDMVRAPLSLQFLLDVQLFTADLQSLGAPWVVAIKLPRNIRAANNIKTLENFEKDKKKKNFIAQ